MVNILEMKENEQYKNNRVYYSENEKRIIYDAEFDCKKVATTLKRMVKEVPALSWILDFPPEENGQLPLEYDGYVVEKFENSVYVAVVCHK